MEILGASQLSWGLQWGKTEGQDVGLTPLRAPDTTTEECLLVPGFWLVLFPALNISENLPWDSSQVWAQFEHMGMSVWTCLCATLCVYMDGSVYARG